MGTPENVEVLRRIQAAVAAGDLDGVGALVDVWSFRDGRAARLEIYRRWDEALAAVGLRA